MKQLIATGVFTASLLTTACAYQSTAVYEKPDGEAFKTSNQLRFASAAHWKLLAEHEAKILAQRIAGKSVVVKQNHSSNFSEIYHNLLTCGLIQNGALVLIEDRPGNVAITYDVKVANLAGGKQVSGLSDRDHWPSFSAAAYYIFSEVAGMMRVLPAVIGEQMVKNLSSATEVVVTTQAVYGVKILYSATNIYYIDGASQWQYQRAPPMPPAPQMSPAEALWNYHAIK